MRILVIAALLVAGVLLMLMTAGCDRNSGPAVGSIEGYVFGQTLLAAAQTPMLALGRGPTPPPGYEPAPGALVMVTGGATVATTDAAGYFRLDRVAVGAQTLTISKSGFLTAVAQVTVVAGQVATAPDTLLTPSERKWTILVFLNADNDLEEFGIEDVNEMEMVGSSPEVDIIVQMDRIAGDDTSNGDWTGCRRLRVVGDSDPNTITSPVLPEGEMGEVDMGDWRVLRDFVQWGVAAYPAEHYMVVLWDHGAGWRSARTAEARNPATRGVSYDGTSGNHISITDLPQALDVQPRLDIICFDASLMQMVEVAYQLRHFGRLMVGSEDSPPGPGYPYQTFLASLVATPTMTPEQFAERIVTQTLDYYASIGYTSGLTQSAVTLAKMDGVALAVDGFGRALATAMPAYSTQITSARTQAQRYAYPDNKDLYDFAQLISSLVARDNVVTAAQTVMQTVQDAVIAEAHNNARRNSHGLAIFIPGKTDYNDFYHPSYQQLEFAANTYWDNWLSVSPP
jgi:hypothetical protein